MGQSTNAILFYGYRWTEETSKPWTIGSEDADEDADEDTGWEERYALTQGCSPPSTPYPSREVPRTRENGYNSTPKDYSRAEQAIIDEYTAYWKAERNIIESAPCLVGTHCSGECPMPYVAISAAHTVTYRGDMNEITSLAVDPAWVHQLEVFCKALGIKTAGKKAAWWLVSDWN